MRAVQREVAIYEAMGLCERVPRGHQVFFRVSREHPLFAELRALLLKASAVRPAPTVTARPEPPAPASPASAPPSPQPMRSNGWRVW